MLVITIQQSVCSLQSLSTLCYSFVVNFDSIKLSIVIDNFGSSEQCSSGIMIEASFAGANTISVTGA